MNFYSPILLKPASTCSPITTKRGGFDRLQLKKNRVIFYFGKMQLIYINLYLLKSGPNSNKVGKGHNLPSRCSAMNCSILFTSRRGNETRPGVFTGRTETYLNCLYHYIENKIWNIYVVAPIVQNRSTDLFFT